MDSGTKATPRLSTVTSTEIRLSNGHDLLEMSIHGLLDDYLGRDNAFDNGDGEDKVVELKSCNDIKATVRLQIRWCAAGRTFVFIFGCGITWL